MQSKQQADASAMVTGGVAEDLREAQGELEARVARVLEVADRLGASAAEVGVSRDLGLSVSVRQGELEQLEFTRDQGFGITVYVGQRRGSASTTDASDAAIEDTVAKALNIARYTAEDPAAGLAPAERLATTLPDLDLFHPWALDADGAIEFARASEAAAIAVDERIRNSEGA